MKKNLLLVLVMALVIVNIVLTSVMMISMMGTNKKTAMLINDIAAILRLEIEPETSEEGEEVLAMSDQKVWNIENTMTCPLKSEDGKNHYIQFEVSFSLNTKSEGYKKYGENIQDYESMVKDKITLAVSKYTVDDCSDNFESIREDILKEVRSLFEDDKLIYRVAISGIKFQ